MIEGGDGTVSLSELWNTASTTRPLLPQTVGIVLQFVGSGNAIVPTLDLSLAILLAYTIPAIAVAAAHFWFADISRKMS